MYSPDGCQPFPDYSLIAKNPPTQAQTLGRLKTFHPEIAHHLNLLGKVTPNPTEYKAGIAIAYEYLSSQHEVPARSPDDRQRIDQHAQAYAALQTTLKPEDRIQLILQQLNTLRPELTLLAQNVYPCYENIEEQQAFLLGMYDVAGFFLTPLATTQASQS